MNVGDSGVLAILMTVINRGEQAKEQHLARHGGEKQAAKRVALSA